MEAVYFPEKQVPTYKSTQNKLQKRSITKQKTNITHRPRLYSFSVLANGPKIHGFKPSRWRWIFKGGKISQHAFLLRGSKAVGPMSQDFTAC
jgi:hypothetical protein